MESTQALIRAVEKMTEENIDSLDESVRKAARRLDMDPTILAGEARKLWGRPFIAEREQRLKSVIDEPARTRQARRGHVTRELVSELEAHLEANPPRSRYREVGSR